jgi:hypothetical protein
MLRGWVAPDFAALNPGYRAHQNPAAANHTRSLLLLQSFAALTYRSRRQQSDSRRIPCCCGFV